LLYQRLEFVAQCGNRGIVCLVLLLLLLGGQGEAPYETPQRRSLRMQGTELRRTTQQSIRHGGIGFLWQ
jgi:hypothetical protein